MKKTTKKEKVNLFLSAFLILGFGVCAYFLSTIAGNSLTNNLIGKSVHTIIFIAFGLILFYATRVGEGKQVKRFSIASLVLICLPALYVIMAYLFNFMPLHNQIGADHNTMAVVIAAIALGYGIPYTFVSGYEQKEEDQNQDEENIDKNLDNNNEDITYNNTDSEEADETIEDEIEDKPEIKNITEDEPENEESKKEE